MTYELKTNDPVETLDEEKVIVETSTKTETKEFTLKEKTIEIDSIDAQIISLQTRRQELVGLIDSVSTTLNLTKTKSDLIVNPK